MKNLNNHKIRTDLILFALMFTLCLHTLTGGLIHEWVGIVVIPVLLWHLCLNWQWLIQVFKRLFGRQSFFVRLNLVMDVLLYLTIGVVIFSGIFISRDFLASLGIRFENDAFLSYLHHKLTAFLFIMVGVHLGLHYRWLFQQISRPFRKTAPAVVSENVSGEADEANQSNTCSAEKTCCLLKYTTRIIVLFLAGVLLTSLVFPVGRTSWSDGIREQVRLARAAKHKKMTEVPAVSREGAPSATTPAVVPSSPNAAPDAAPDAAPNTSPDTTPVAAPVPAPSAEKAPGPSGVKSSSGPKSRPPELSVRALGEVAKFLTLVLVPFLVAAFLTFFAGGSWRKGKSLL